MANRKRPRDHEADAEMIARLRSISEEFRKLRQQIQATREGSSDISHRTSVDGRVKSGRRSRGV